MFSESWPEYESIEFTAPRVLEKPDWADPEDWRNVKFNVLDGEIDRRSHHGPYNLDKNRRPLNPIGIDSIIN